jgi:hypothetical protein
MKKYLLIALLLGAVPAIATTPPNPCGNHGNNCDPDPPTTTPGNQSQTQSNDQGQQQNATGTGTGIAVAGGGAANAAGGAGGAGGHGGTAVAGGGSATGGSAQGGAGGTATSGSASGAISGSLSGVQGSGNASLGDVGSTSAAVALSNASNGDQSLSGTQTTDVANGSASNSGATANGTVNVDAADRSSTRYSNRTNVFVPGDLPANAMTIAPGATITVAGDQQCGVLLTKVRIPVYQWDKKGKTKREVGYDEDVAPFVDANGVQIDFQRVDTGNGGYYLRGSHATYIASTYGSSTSSQLGLQGYGPGGGGGISAGKGNSYSQAGVRIVIRPCISSVVDPVQQLPLIQFSEPRVPRG